MKKLQWHLDRDENNLESYDLIIVSTNEIIAAIVPNNLSIPINQGRNAELFLKSNSKNTWKDAGIHSLAKSKQIAIQHARQYFL